MTTDSNMKGRAGTAGRPADSQPPALYPGATVRRVACPGTSSFNPGGRLARRHALRPEGVRRIDRRQLQT
jgi:hypothetical protein